MKSNKKTILFSKEGYIGRLVSYQLLFICWSRMGSNLSCKQEYTRQNTNFLSQTTFNQFAAESVEISSKYVQKFFRHTEEPNRSHCLFHAVDDALCVLCGRVPDLQSGGCGFESQPGLLRTKVYSAFHPGVGKWVPAAAEKAGMAHSDCGWTCGCAGKTVKSLENTRHTWAHLQWWFTTKRRYIKCMHLYLYQGRCCGGDGRPNLY